MSDDDVNNRGVADLITNRLGSLSHPDGKPTQSVLGNTKTMQPGMAEIVQKAAARLGTSIVHTIEQSGYTIINTGDLQELRNQATESAAHDTIKLVCNQCGGRIFDMMLSDPSVAKTNGANLRKYLAAPHDTPDVCNCGT